MKRILITGANSYIGTSVEKYLTQWPEEYQVDTIDMRGDAWREKSFAGYDSVFHVAGIAHTKQTKENEALFFQVNRNLAIDVAKKAKSEGVLHFIFLSSMSVYGMSIGIIGKDKTPAPKNAYGKSKLEAEEAIQAMLDNSFKVAVLRPPMVYGKGCKGNYQQLSYFARTFPVFPNIQNKRSMLFIGNLVDFIKECVDLGSAGLFFPQNRQYVSTSDMVKKIASAHQRSIYLTKFFNPFIKLLPFKLLKKVFCDLYYTTDIAPGVGEFSFEESILLTERCD